MDYSLSQLEAFVATVETGSFKNAGLHLNKRPQVIAKLVSALEDSCNLSLFERQVRQLNITDEGKILYRLAKRIMQDALQFEQQLDAFDQDLPNEFRVAIDTNLASPELTQCYLAVLNEIPTIQLEVLSGDTLDVLQWVKNGQAEIGLVFSPLADQDDLTQIYIFHFSMVEVAAPSLVNRGAILSEQELVGLTQIVPRFIYHYKHEEVYVFSDRTIINNSVQESIEMMLAGIGWCRLPSSLVEQHLKSGTLNEFSVEGANRVIWQGSVVYPKNQELSIAGDIFMDRAMALTDKID